MGRVDRSLISVAASLVLAGSLSGDITISDANTTGVTSGGDENITVTSSGSVAVTGSTDAISVSSTLLSGNSIVNDGNITAGGDGIFVQGDNNGTISNSGTISTYGNNSEGILAIYNTGNIVNSGTITSDRAGIVAVENNGVILNSGTITAGDVGIYVVATNAGTIINNASLWVNDVDAGGTFTNTGTAVGAIYAKGVDASNSGTITLKHNQNAEVENFTQSGEGTLNVGMYIAEGTTTAQTSTVIADANITIADGSTINVNVTNTSDATISSWYDTLSESSTLSGYRDFNNSQGLIASAGDTLDANASTLNITDNSTLLSYSVEKEVNSLNLLVKKVQNALTTLVSSQGASSSAGGAASALDAIFSAGSVNGDIDEFLTNMDALGSDAAKVQAIISTTPVAALASNSVVSQSAGTISGIVQTRQSSMRGYSSGDALFRDKNIWIRPYASFADQDNENSFKGFSATTKGIAIGVDGEMDESRRIGLSLFLSDTDVDTNDINQQNDIKGYTFVAYGSAPVIDSKTMFYYQAGLGVQKNESSRYIQAVNQTASAKYDSKTFMVQTSLQRELSLNEDLNIIPSMQLAYRYFKNPSYSESGAGGMNLNVESFSDNEVVLGLGSDIDYRYSSSTNLYGGVMGYYDFNNDAQSVVSSYQGASNVNFNTTGIKNASLTYGASAGMAQDFSNGFSLNIDYGVSAKTSGFINHAISAKLNYKLQ